MNHPSLFAYGCSFTDYSWTTWADIIGSQFPRYTNRGKAGSGNMKIFTDLMQDIATGLVTDKDVVMICWTNVAREDRFINGKWVTPGNIFTQNIYPPEWVKKYVDIEFCYIRDLALIQAARLSLQQIGCTYHSMSMVPMDIGNQYNHSRLTYPVFDQYRTVLGTMGPNFYDMFDGNWQNPRFPYLPADNHPLPIMHLEFVRRHFPQYTIPDDIANLLQEETEMLIQANGDNRNHLDVPPEVQLIPRLNRSKKKFNQTIPPYLTIRRVGDPRDPDTSG